MDWIRQRYIAGRLALRLAERAVDRPFDPRTSLRINSLVVALEAR